MYDCLDSEEVIPNPNFFVTLTSIENGYITGEDGTIILSQTNNDTLYYGE